MHPSVYEPDSSNSYSENLLELILDEEEELRRKKEKQVA